MKPEIRKLFLKICGGASDLHVVTQRLYYLDVHFPPEKLESALTWLTKNQLTGRHFMQFVLGECAGSNLELHRKLIAAVEQEKYTRPLYASKDLKQI